MAETFMILQLAQSLLDHGQRDQARSRLHEAGETVQSTGERLFEPELNRVLGECEGGADPARADEYYRLALDQARSHGDRALELRAVTSMSRLWRSDPARRAEVRALLSGVMATFSPADTSVDLRDARATLAGLD
jgi:hypothetical protein